DPDLIVFRKCVNGDVAFGDEDESGYAPILRLVAVVLEDVRLRDLGHPDFIRVAVEQVADDLHTGEPSGVSAEPIDRNVHSRVLSPPLKPGGAGMPGTKPGRR